MWFQHDGAPAHFPVNVMKYLEVQFGQRWICCGGPDPWPAEALDMTPMDLFFWVHVKNLVCETPVDILMDLVARVIAAV